MLRFPATIKPVNERIYLSAPDVGELEEAALVRAIRSGWVAPLGPEVDAFEAELAQRSGRGHAVALSSGTAALHLGLLNFGVQPGDVVMTASMTFAATANAVTYTNATPVFVDCDETGSINPELLAHGIHDQLNQGNRVSAIVPVDLLGKIVDHEAIRAIADEHRVPVLSDAAESLGAIRNGRPAGAYGDAAAISFNGNKIMTTSGGGALLTDDPEMAQRARYLATQARQPAVHYEHTEIGYNYRMSNLLAALGRAQLSRLDEMIERRRQHRVAYGSIFADIDGVQVFGKPDGVEGGATVDNFWLTSILVDPAVTGWEASSLIAFMTEANIEARPLWKPMHLQPVFAEHPCYVDGTSQRLFVQGLSLPSGSALTSEQFDRVTDEINRFLERQS